MAYDDIDIGSEQDEQDAIDDTQASIDQANEDAGEQVEEALSK